MHKKCLIHDTYWYWQHGFIKELFIYFDQSTVSIQSIVIQYQQNYLVVNIIAKIIKMTWMYDWYNWDSVYYCDQFWTCFIILSVFSLFTFLGIPIDCNMSGLFCQLWKAQSIMLYGSRLWKVVWKCLFKSFQLSMFCVGQILC